MTRDTFTDSIGRKWHRVVINPDNVSNICGQRIIKVDQLVVALFNDTYLCIECTGINSDMHLVSTDALQWTERWDQGHRPWFAKWHRLVDYLRDLKSSVVEAAPVGSMPKCGCGIDVLMNQGCQCGGE